MLRIVKTESGYVQGVPGSDVRTTVFKGIPFAADTSGKNRWRAPQPVEPWEGIRDCSRFAPITMQKVPGEDPNAFYSKEWHCEPEIEMGEDSLALNIWTPTKTGDEKMPVMVWIFGGGLQEGYCHEMEFDGEGFNRRGVILVSIAYRLNVFGFFAHPDLTAEDPEHPTNFGLLDQVAGIEWVRRNIANFGGDPENITIFGQSAGAGSTMYHMTCPRSNGLFKKAIAQSAGGIVPLCPPSFIPTATPLEEAEKRGIQFLKDLGVSTIDEARQLDAKYVENKYWETCGGLMSGFNATIDGKFILDQWYKRVLDGKINDAELMTGNTYDEFPMKPMEDIETWIKNSFGDYAEEYLEIVKRAGGDAKAAQVNAFELGGLLMASAFAKYGKPVYYYEFGPEIPGDDAGAFHSSELWFTFETLMKCWRPFTGKHYDLARKMNSYWANWATKGDPNGKDRNGEELPQWRKYTKDDPFIILFEDTIRETIGPESEKSKFLLDINLKGYDL